MEIVKLSKKFSQFIYQVYAGRSKDDARPVLMGMHISKDAYTSCDGFVIHSARRSPKTCELSAYEGKTVILHGLASRECLVEVEIVEGIYPNFPEIHPETPIFGYAFVNARLLTRALRMNLNGQGHHMVKIEFHKARVAPTLDKEGKELEPARFIDEANTSCPIVIYGVCDHPEDMEAPTYAVIMPMHAGREKKEWRPKSM